MDAKLKEQIDAAADELLRQNEATKKRFCDKRNGRLDEIGTYIRLSVSRTLNGSLIIQTAQTRLETKGKDTVAHTTRLRLRTVRPNGDDPVYPVVLDAKLGPEIHKLRKGQVPVLTATIAFKDNGEVGGVPVGNISQETDSNGLRIVLGDLVLSDLKFSRIIENILHNRPAVKCEYQGETARLLK